MEGMNKSYEKKIETDMICPVCNSGTIVRRMIQYGLHIAEVEICDNCGWLVNPIPGTISDIRKQAKEKPE